VLDINIYTCRKVLDINIYTCRKVLDINTYTCRKVLDRNIYTYTHTCTCVHMSTSMDTGNSPEKS